MSDTKVASASEALAKAKLQIDPKTQKKLDKLKKATQDFEAIFIGTMLKEARKSLNGSHPLFGDSYEAKQYQEMMDDKMAEQMSRSGSFGLSKTLYKSLEENILREANLLPAPVNPAKKAL
jgi:flagellar protein FlgJ